MGGQDDDKLDELQREQDEAYDAAVDAMGPRCAHCGEMLPDEKFEDPLQEVFRHVECSECGGFSKLTAVDHEGPNSPYDSEADDPPPPYVPEELVPNGQQDAEKGKPVAEVTFTSSPSR